MNSLDLLIEKIGMNYQETEGRKADPLFLNYEYGQVREIFYEQFLEDVGQIRKICRGLPERRIGLAGGNSYEWMIIAAALLLENKQVILFDVNLKDDDFAHLVKYADAEALILPDDLKEQMDFISKDIAMYSYQSLKRFRFKDDGKRNDDRASFMCFTSGTSKSSKGVVISVDSLVRIVELAAGSLPGGTGQRYFVPIPLHHIYAFTTVFHIMMNGGTVCLGTSPRQFQKELEAFDPHTAFLVPSMLRFLLEWNLSSPSLSCVVTGGSPCPEGLSRQAVERGFIYYNFYGLSETLGWIANSVPGQEVKWLKPVAGVSFFCDEDGELGILLPAHMDEYYKKKEDTEKVLSGDVFRTGDSGMVNGEGYACILGRVRDTIVLENGEKIHAEDKDQELLGLPHIKDAAVFHTRTGLAAAIVPDGEMNWDELCGMLERYDQKQPPFQRIRRYWCHVGELPRTSTGKLKRFLLEKEYDEQRKEEEE